IAQRAIADLAPVQHHNQSPWAVANMTRRGQPPPSWDNAFRDSHSLGYVVATHQSLHPFPRDTVLTWYQPLDHAPPVLARQEALSNPWSAWRDQVLADMRPAHPDIAPRVTHLDVML